jgi:tRNA pseudouridine13 synthase
VGDIAFKHGNGACFRIEDPAAENLRAETFEISPTGPMYGRKMLVPEGRPAEIENGILAAAGLTRELFNSTDTNRMEGERRPLRVPITNHSVNIDESGLLLLEFALPKGSYATSVLREIMKTE